MSDKIILDIEKKFDASIQDVWNAWTTTAGLSAWFGPDNATVVECSADFAVGGAYSISMDVGESTHTVAGEYKEIVPMEKFVCSFKWAFENSVEMMITVMLREEDGKTVMHFLQEGFPDEQSKEMHMGGWTGSFEKLQTLLG